MNVANATTTAKNNFVLLGKEEIETIDAAWAGRFVEASAGFGSFFAFAVSAGGFALRSGDTWFAERSSGATTVEVDVQVLRGARRR